MPDPVPDVAWFDRAARRIIAALPAPFAGHLEGVVIRVEELPDRAVLDKLGIAHPLDLLGLYSGVSLDRKSAWDAPRAPDMIFLYRRPVIVFARDRGEPLERVIRHVIIHEAGHHFGLSDQEMAAIEESDRRRR